MYHRPLPGKAAYVFSSEVVVQVRPVAALEARDVQKGPIMIQSASCVVELSIVSFICTVNSYEEYTLDVMLSGPRQFLICSSNSTRDRRPHRYSWNIL